MESESFYEPINLLVLAEKDILQNNFIENLKGFLQNGNYKPSHNYSSAKYMGNTTFRALYHEFNIINGPGISESDTSEEIFSKFSKIQDHFIQPINLNAIIFLMKPDPRCYEHFLSLNLFNNFSKDDMAKIERNVIFVFVHDNLESYQKRDTVHVDLWTVLDRIGADLLHSLTLHCQSPLDRDFCNIFLQFLNRNKKTLPVETVYSHESVLKKVGNEDFMDILLDALYVNEINIENQAAGENSEYYYLYPWCYYCYVCTNKKCLRTCRRTNSRELLENKSTCTQCNCFVKDHKFSTCSIQKETYNSQYAGKQKEYRHTLIIAIVAIDLFHKENNASVSQLHHRIMERIKQETSYSVLETLYKNEMDGHKKGITADDCMKRVRNSLLSLEGLIKFNVYFKKDSLSVRGSLRVKN